MRNGQGKQARQGKARQGKTRPGKAMMWWGGGGGGGLQEKMNEGMARAVCPEKGLGGEAKGEESSHDALRTVAIFTPFLCSLAHHDPPPLLSCPVPSHPSLIFFTLPLHYYLFIS